MNVSLQRVKGKWVCAWRMGHVRIMHKTWCIIERTGDTVHYSCVVGLVRIVLNKGVGRLAVTQGCCRRVRGQLSTSYIADKRESQGDYYGSYTQFHASVSFFVYCRSSGLHVGVSSALTDVMNVFKFRYRCWKETYIELNLVLCETGITKLYRWCRINIR